MSTRSIFPTTPLRKFTIHMIPLCINVSDNCSNGGRGISLLEGTRIDLVRIYVPPHMVYYIVSNSSLKQHNRV